MALTGRLCKACELVRDRHCALRWRRQWKIKSRLHSSWEKKEWMQDKCCMRQFGENIKHSHLTDSVSHFFCFSLVSQNLLLFFVAVLYFFFSHSLCSFCWVLTLQGFTQRNQFCLASLPLEGNIGIYKYSHAAISDPQLRDWTSGWAVLLFDHEACIQASLWMISLFAHASRVPQAVP